MGRIALTGIASALLLSGTMRLVSANLAIPDHGTARAAEVVHGEPADAAGTPTPAALDEIEVLLRDIARRDEELTARAAALELRERDMGIARAELERTLDELTAAEAALEARMFASAEASENDLGRLTAIYESMKPKDAAALFEAMEPGFAAGFLGRMDADVAAEVFSNMPPLAAYAVSATIAGRNADAAREAPR
ncbi:hypothetical protein [Jannaschia sp. LMIT008]|uniref:MotE family protein n=1 Tax=Jannaschia maritima TaxID=3032585 RepID=UPI002810F42B|nr:hypothetical protein [Jannaschia sp. LMIT008]